MKHKDESVDEERTHEIRLIYYALHLLSRVKDSSTYQTARELFISSCPQYSDGLPEHYNPDIAKQMLDAVRNLRNALKLEERVWEEEILIRKTDSLNIVIDVLKRNMHEIVCDEWSDCKGGTDEWLENTYERLVSRLEQLLAKSHNKSKRYELERAYHEVLYARDVHAALGNLVGSNQSDPFETECLLYDLGKLTDLLMSLHPKHMEDMTKPSECIRLKSRD
jgi:hypothetical protein